MVKEGIKYHDHGNTPSGQGANVDMYGQSEFEGCEETCVEKEYGYLHKGKTDHKGEPLDPQSL